MFSYKDSARGSAVPRTIVAYEPYFVSATLTPQTIAQGFPMNASNELALRLVTAILREEKRTDQILGSVAEPTGDEEIEANERAKMRSRQKTEVAKLAPHGSAEVLLARLNAADKTRPWGEFVEGDVIGGDVARWNGYLRIVEEWLRD